MGVSTEVSQRVREIIMVLKALCQEPRTKIVDDIDLDIDVYRYIDVYIYIFYYLTASETPRQP